MSDNLVKARIKKLTNQITEAGLTVPTLPEELSLTEQEAVLKEFWGANRPNPEDGKLAAIRRKADLLGIPYENDTDEETIRLSVQEVEKALKDKGKKQLEERKEQNVDVLAVAKEIGESIAKNLRQPKDGEERVVTEREYDPNDLTESKTYFAPMVYWKLPAKRIGGQVVKAPWGKIEFKMLEGSSIRSGSRNQTRYLCAYTTDSKKEQAYMETHPLFRKVFYPSDNESRITNDDVKFAIKFGEQQTMLQTHQAPELYRIAADLESEGVRINTTMSLSAIRTECAGALARRAMRQEKEHMASLIRAGAREDLLRQQNA